MLALFAQAGSHVQVISEASAVSWGILIALLVASTMWGAAMARLARVEKDKDATDERVEVLEKRLGRAELEVAVIVSSLGRIEASQARIEARFESARQGAA